MGAEVFNSAGGCKQAAVPVPAADRRQHVCDCCGEASLVQFAVILSSSSPCTVVLLVALVVMSKWVLLACRTACRA